MNRRRRKQGCDSKIHRHFVQRLVIIAMMGSVKLKVVLQWDKKIKHTEIQLNSKQFGYLGSVNSRGCLLFSFGLLFVALMEKHPISEVFVIYLYIFEHFVFVLAKTTTIKQPCPFCHLELWLSQELQRSTGWQWALGKQDDIVLLCPLDNTPRAPRGRAEIQHLC